MRKNPSSEGHTSSWSDDGGLSGSVSGFVSRFAVPGASDWVLFDVCALLRLAGGAEVSCDDSTLSDSISRSMAGASEFEFVLFESLVDSSCVGGGSIVGIRIAQGVAIKESFNGVTAAAV